MGSEIDMAVQRQIDRLTSYCITPVDKPNLDITTKYWSQRDNIEQSWRTCNSTTCAMYLDWLMRVTGRKGLSNDQIYVDSVLKKGDTTIHEVQTLTIKDYGFSTKWMTDRDTNFIVALLKIGFPVPVNILHRGSISKPTGGHIILLVGFSNDSYVAHDPYGTLMSNYSNTNGKHSVIPKEHFNKRWQGGYRILA